MTSDNDAWVEWEEDNAVLSPRSPSSASFHDHIPKSQAHLAMSDSSSCDAGDWRFDLSELEQEMSTLAPVASSTPYSVADATDGTEERLLLALDTLPSILHDRNAQMQTLKALALVACLHVVAARGSFAKLQSDTQIPLEQLKSLNQELEKLAGEWGQREHLETTLMATTRRQLDEMTELLRHALSAGGKDLTLFQDVIEQLFGGFTEQTLVLSTNWLKREREAKEESETGSYLNQVVAIYSDKAAKTSRVPTISEAEIFQDAKDIERDELQINGKRVEGKRGYDAVVDALQRESELVLARQVGKTPEQTPMAVSNALQSVAMAVLHASNRTESGGSSFDLLATFLNNHEMDRVLLRPASARAAPLRVDMDVGPYLETVPGSKEQTWAFGLRVKLSAVTYYLMCEATDPSNELYEIETTFCNRLAFPVGLTPFHPLDSMRKDCGNVAVRLVLK